MYARARVCVRVRAQGGYRQLSLSEAAVVGMAAVVVGGGHGGRGEGFTSGGGSR